MKRIRIAWSPKESQETIREAQNTVFNQLRGRVFTDFPSLPLESAFLIALVKLEPNLVVREAYSFFRKVCFSQFKEMMRHRQPKSVREKKNLARVGGILLINYYANVYI